MTHSLTPAQIALREVFHTAWGPYLHIGVFARPDESIADAAARSARLTAEKVNPQAGDKVLEVGCGFGYTAEMLARTFHCRVVATDIEGWRIEKAGHRVKDLDGLVFEQADHGNLPYREESYHLVWATGTLSYASDLNKSIIEVARVLKPNGRVLIRDFNTATSVDNPERIERKTCTHRLWSLDQWKSALAGAGLCADLLEDETDNARDTYRRLEDAFHGLIDTHGDAAVKAEGIMANRLQLIETRLFGCFLMIARKQT